MKDLSQDLFYKNFITFLSNLSIEWGVPELYKKIDFFLRDELSIDPLLVYSLSKQSLNIKDSNHYKFQLRRVYKTLESQLTLESRGFRDFMNFVDYNDFSDQRWLFEKGEGKTYFAFLFGAQYGQLLVGFGQFKGYSSGKKDKLKFVSDSLDGVYNNFQTYERVVEENTLVHVDDVTGLFNQRKLNDDLDKWIGRYHSFGETFAVLFIDVDHFKHVNDGHGHLVGTQILAEIGTLLKGVLRKNDLIYRYGGDEFVLIIPNADKPTAQTIGERILKKVKGKEFVFSESQKGFNLSVSIGIALFPENGKSRQDILALADKMMYAAKSSGRGTVRMALEYFE